MKSYIKHKKLINKCLFRRKNELTKLKYFPNGLTLIELNEIHDK